MKSPSLTAATLAKPISYREMNSYDKLRPWAEIESCGCETVDRLLLVDLLTDNPIHCAACRCEVDPERISLTSHETDSIAHWFSASSALFRLWLHSGEYEDYAKARLLDPSGQVNVEGLGIARELSAKIPTEMWYFFDTDDGEPTSCPVCCNPLDSDVEWGSARCKSCHLRI